MKKLIALAIALLFVIPAFAMADDKVSVSGTYYLRYYDAENYSDLNDDLDDEMNYFKSRFRLATTIKPADDVKAYFRFDLQEGRWGDQFNNTIGAWQRTGGTATNFHVDYAWVEVDKEMWKVRVGWQYVGFGLGLTEFGNQAIRFTFKTPVIIDLYYAKTSEGASISDEGKANEDEDFYALNLSYKADGFQIDGFYAMVDNSATDFEQSLFGIYGTASFGMIDFLGQLEILDGELGTTDYVGTQLVLQGKANVTEQIMVGLQILYAEGSDDANEVVINEIAGCDLWSFRPLSYGLMETWDVEPVDPFSIAPNAGMQAVQLIADFQATDDLLFQAALAYAQPEEDKMTALDSAMIFNVSFTYTFATNAKVGLHYNLMMPDMDSTYVGPDDDASALMGAFTLKF